MSTQHVKVKRSFLFNREPTKVGAVIEVSKLFAAELKAAGKAEDAPAPPLAKDEPIPSIESIQKATKSQKGEK